MLHLHRSERADGLADALAELLADPPDDPFAVEVVAVPTRGIERWLAQRLSGRLGTSAGRDDGVCAGIEFPAPGPLLAAAVATAAGHDPDRDPWRPERAVWPLLEIVEAELREPWLQILATHLQRSAARDPEEAPRARRLATVRRVAGLFDSYAGLRPEMLAAWAEGQDTDGHGTVLAAEHRWQPELWRRLRARLAVPGPAERLATACARLAAEPDCVELPGRLTVFGLTRLPTGQRRVLDALAQGGREIHLYLLHPSHALWQTVAAAEVGPGPLTRRADATTGAVAHRLLASWGRDVREMQLVLRTSASRPTTDVHQPSAATTAEPSHLLARIQADLAADRPPPGPPAPGAPDGRPVLAPGDDTIRIHACHGRARQVEVLRDAILHLLADDATLEPRDVIVMCPDIETFAPLIRATFGSAAEGPELRVRLADRSLRGTNPVLGTVAALLDLAGTRVTASQLLDLADRDPVRRRFGFDDDAVARLTDWIADAGIRWGLDQEHRVPFGLGRFREGTWRFGLDRTLLGVTMTEEGQRLFADVLPLDDVESGAIDLAGRLAEFVARVAAALEEFAQPQNVAAWTAALAAAADALCAVSERDGWQRAELGRLLDELAGEASGEDGAARLAVTLPEIRELLADRLRGRPTRANFRTGSLTVCTLHPMRSVPHRVVCLLGLDDDTFPRTGTRDGDDLTLLEPLVGERDPRSEDRQLLLDAVMAAREHLVITYAGADERTGKRRPPSVPVGELLDVVDATVRVDDGPGRRASAAVVVEHALQPFDPRNFTRGAVAGRGSWSFEGRMRDGAAALAGPRRDAEPFLPAPLPRRPVTVVDLEDLVRFGQEPVKTFLRSRLGIALTREEDDVEDALRVELDKLQEWGVGDRLLAARLRGVDARAACLAEIQRGTLPPGILGQPVLAAVEPTVAAIVASTNAALGGPPDPRSVDVRVGLAGGRSLRGTVPGVSGTVLATSVYSRLAPKHRLAAWIRLLALAGSGVITGPTAVTVGRAPRGTGVCVAELRPPGDPAEAAARLAELADLMEAGLREPLPLPCATAAAYAAAALAGEIAEDAAGREWTSVWAYPKEDAAPEHVLAFGGVITLAELLARPPASTETGPGWPEDPSRLGRLAGRVWAPLLAHETVRYG